MNLAQSLLVPKGQRLRARSMSQCLYLSDVGKMGTVLYISDPNVFWHY